MERNLGVKNTVASSVLPLGATVNMDGTALYQGEHGVVRNAVELGRGQVPLAEIMQQAALHRQDRPFDPSYYEQTKDRRVDSEQCPVRVDRIVTVDG